MRAHALCHSLSKTRARKLWGQISKAFQKKNLHISWKYSKHYMHIISDPDKTTCHKRLPGVHLHQPATFPIQIQMHIETKRNRVSAVPVEDIASSTISMLEPKKGLDPRRPWLVLVVGTHSTYSHLGVAKDRCLDAYSTNIL